MNEPVKFIANYLKLEESVSPLCKHLGISRKTRYKWVALSGGGGLRKPGLVPQQRRRCGAWHGDSRETISPRMRAAPISTPMASAPLTGHLPQPLLAAAELGAVVVRRSARAENPPNHDADEENRRDEDEVTGGHVAEFGHRTAFRWGDKVTR